jgi:uncharacterized protein (TIRG00374 family)
MSSHGKTILGVLLSVLLLGWALRDVSPAAVIRELRGVDPLLFTLSIAIALGGFVVRAVRWGILLRPVRRRLAFYPRVAATFIGFAANNLLPARVGEFARALALARSTTVPAAAAFASLAVERILDGIVLVGLLFAAMAAPGFPRLGSLGGVDPRHAALVVAALMAVGALVLFLLVIAPARSLRAGEAVARLLPHRLRGPFLGVLEAFLEGLAVLRSGPLFLLSAGLAAGQWIFTGLSYLLAFRAFGIEAVPFTGGLFLQSLVSLAVAIPSSPGFFGPFEAATKFGLGLWGVPPARAVSFAIGYHLGGFVPVTVLGLYYTWRLNLRWSDVRHSEEEVEKEAEHPAGAPPVEQGAR